MHSANRTKRPEPQGLELLLAQLCGVLILLGLGAFVCGASP